MSTLGERIKKAREDSGLYQARLAELVGAKSSAVISNWEKDINKPDADKIVKICEALGVSLAYLLDYYGPTPSLSPSESELLALYRRLNEQGQGYVMTTARMASENPEMQKSDTASETA